MKKLLTIFCALAATLTVTTSCKDDKKSQKLDPNAMISLRPDTKQAANVATKANPEHLSAIEIVKQAVNIDWYYKPIQSDPVSYTFSEKQRDTTNVRLMMWGTDIIAQDGRYNPGFVRGEDMVLIRGIEDPSFRIDTIAYIPNAVLRAADVAIKAAYDQGEYETCYRLFDEAFTFQPITGEEWRALKAEGKN